MSKRLKIPKLREMDDTMLQVVTSDVLTMLMDFVDPGTMVDLLAVCAAELPVHLRDDFNRFRDQMNRDMADLPRGPVLATYLKDLIEVEPTRIPDSFRRVVKTREEDALANPASTAAWEELMENWQSTAFEPVDRAAAIASMRVQMPDVPDRLKTPVEREKNGGTTATGKTRATKAKAPAKPSRDPERDKWLRTDILGRLKQYEGRGLKQSVLVAGTIRRSTLGNTTKAEVMSVLRVLKRENLVKESSGRWILRGRW